MRAHRGFTLIELMMVVAIAGILAALAVGSYSLYVIRGQLAQTLADYGHIRQVVYIETQVADRGELQAGSVAGEVPPALATLLSRTEFNQRDGMTLQLVKAPAGTFASYPSQEVYALIAAASSAPGQRRLRLLRNVLPQGDGDKLWLSESSLYFPLDPATGGLGAPPVPPVTPPVTPPPTRPPGTGWDNVQATNRGPTWDAEARVCISGTDGKPLSSDLNAQVQIRVVQQVRTWDGKTTERSWLTQAPIVNGCTVFSQPGLPTAASGVEGVAGIRFEIVGVIYYWPQDPPIKWDGSKPAQSIEAPK